MTENSGTGAINRCLVVAVIVLYRTQPLESVAFASLSALLGRQKIAPGTIRCVLYDNGPEPQQVPPQDFPVIYHHDPNNPGLAAAYNSALAEAEQRNAPWLLLLDQDTHLTSVYLEEALHEAARLRDDGQIVSLAPKLLQGDLLLSPHWPPRYPASLPLRQLSGPMAPALRVFNSGAWVRVTAVRAIGGFPDDFPLDYLDHAVFVQLQQKSKRVYLLRAELQHDLALLHMDFVQELGHVPRLESILRAEARFYLQYGTMRDKCIFALRRLRLLFRLVIAGNRSGFLLTLRSSLRP